MVLDTLLENMQLASELSDVHSSHISADNTLIQLIEYLKVECTVENARIVDKIVEKYKSIEKFYD